MKRIDKLTKAQEARFSEWRDKWIKVGLQTGAADWSKAEKAIRACYYLTKLEEPKVVVRVESPLILALAAPIAAWMLNKKGGAVGVAVRGAVHGAVRDAVGDAVHGAVGDAVGDARTDLRDFIKNRWYYYLGGQFWVGGWWGSPAFVSFFTNVCGLKLSKEIQAKAIAYREVCESACWWWPHTDFCMVSDRPKFIHRDNRGSLHSLEGPAIGWNNFELYFIHGVKLELELYNKVVSKTMTFKEVMGLDNIEQRMIALKLLEPDLLLKGAKAKLLQRSLGGNELYLIDKIFSQPAYFLKYSCPSTGRVYLSGVPPEVGIDGDADAAMGWKFGLKKDEYVNITAQS